MTVAHAGLVPRNPVEFVNEIERALGVGRAFHVDANKILGRHAGGFGDQAADDFVGHFLVHVQAHVGQLDADIRVQFGGGDFVEQMVVQLGAGAGFVGVGDVLAEIVDGDAGADLIHRRGGANGIRNLFAGDEAGGDALSKAGALGDGAQGSALGEGDECALSMMCLVVAGTRASPVQPGGAPGSPSSSDRPKSSDGSGRVE
jgi:hypothetical protein